jgi:pimeloyl-ACP methyl ester carboxylesterase
MKNFWRIAVATALVLPSVLGCRGPSLERGSASCAHVQAEREVYGAALCEDAWTCARPPGGRFDRIGLHRLALCEGATGPVVLYLPGMHMSGELPVVDPRQDVRLYLAAAGVRTWSLDYRTHAVPSDASAADLEVMRKWDSDLFVGDATWAAGFVRGADQGPFHLAAFSQGAAFAYRMAAGPDVPLAGLLVLDGAIGENRNVDDGPPAIDVGGSRLPFAERARLLGDVIADPSRPSPVVGFANAGSALANILYSAPTFGGEGGLSNARDGVSDVKVVATLLRGYDRWWPRAAVATASKARPSTPLPVLAFASTNMGPAWVERVRSSAQAYGGRGARVEELPGYGHLDVLVGRHAVEDVFQPALDWLLGRPSS